MMGFEPRPDLQAQYRISLSVMSPLFGLAERVASVSLAPIGGFQKQVLPMTINYFVWTTVQVLILHYQHWLPPRLTVLLVLQISYHFLVSLSEGDIFRITLFSFKF